MHFNTLELFRQQMYNCFERSLPELSLAVRGSLHRPSFFVSLTRRSNVR